MSTLHDDTTVSMPELDSVVERLCHSSSLDAVWHRPAQGAAMPSLDALKEIMERLRAAVFPGYFGSTRIRRESMRYHLAANLDSIYHKLSEQILRGFCFSCEGRHAATPCEACESEGTAAALKFMDRLPEIRRLLAGDAQAAYEEGQTVLCSLEEQYDNVISWADLYNTASLEAKKMIVNCLIRRVEVYRDYKLHIDFNIDFAQFSLGLDIVEIAA